MEDRYEIRGKIGQGGLGAVYRAFDRKMNREVAIKRISSGGNDGIAGESTRQLLKEASALASLQHPHIVTVHDFGSDEDGPYVVMELISGKTLDEIIQHAPLTWQDFRELALQTQEALIAAQDLDLIHSDLKPSNLMLTWLPSGKFQVKVVDFGLAMLTQEQCRKEIESLDSVFGSIFFMPPEQFERKPLDSRSDMYSIGCVYYQALSCRYPFHGRTANEVMASHLKHSVTPLHELRDDIPQWISDWVMWHMKRQPAERPESARQALSTFLQNDRMANPPMCPGKSIQEEPKRPKLVIPTPSPTDAPSATASSPSGLPLPAAPAVVPIPIPPSATLTPTASTQAQAAPISLSPTPINTPNKGGDASSPAEKTTPSPTPDRTVIPAVVPPLKPAAAAPPAAAIPLPVAPNPTKTAASAPPSPATPAASQPPADPASRQRAFERPKLVLPKLSPEDLQKSSTYPVSGLTSTQPTIETSAARITTVQHLAPAPATPITTTQSLIPPAATPITAIQPLTPAPATPITTFQPLAQAPATPVTAIQSLPAGQAATPHSKPSSSVIVSPRDVPSVKSAPVATLQPSAQPVSNPQPLQPPAGSKPSLHTAQVLPEALPLAQAPPTGVLRNQPQPTAILKRTGTHSLAGAPQTHTSVTVLPSAPVEKRGISNAFKAMIAITLLILISILSWVLLDRMKQNRQAEALDKLVSDAARATATELPINKADLDLLLASAVNVSFNKHRGSIYKALLIAKATDGTEIDKTMTTFVTTREMLPDVKETLIKDVLRMRKNPVIVPTLVNYASSTSDTRSAIASLQAVRFMVDEQHFESFIRIIQGSSDTEVRRNAEETAMEIIRKSSIKGQLAESLALHYTTALNNQIRYALLRLLGACGGNKALSILQAALASGDNEQIIAAISALGSWGDDAGFPVLVEFVKSSQDLNMRARAFDAAHRYLGHTKDPSKQSAQWTLLSTQAKTRDEQIKILNGIANLDGEWAFTLAQTYLKSGDEKVVEKAEKVQEYMEERRKLNQ